MPSHDFTGLRRDAWIVSDDCERVDKVEAERVVITSPPLAWRVDCGYTPPVQHERWFVPHEGHFAGKHTDVGTYYTDDELFFDEIEAWRYATRRCSEEMEKARVWTTRHFKAASRVRELLGDSME